MIELKDINVSFKSERQEKIFGTTRVQVLHGVNLQISKGSFLGILGESGSGKSTLERVICGLLKPDCGKMLVDGVSVYDTRKGKKIYSWEGTQIWKNSKFGVELERLLLLVGLDSSYLKRFPHELSGGQLQRVCIARAVACEPEIILFDEAISSLDAHTQVQVMDLLRELKKKLGLTYIFITHDLTSVTYLCDDVMFLYKGHVTDHRPVKTLAQTKDEYARRLLRAIITYDVEETV